MIQNVWNCIIVSKSTLQFAKVVKKGRDFNMNPVISFAIATYNRKSVVTKLVNNLLSLERSDIEVVVVDDCSTDGTMKQLGLIEDERLTLHEHTHNTNGKITWYDAYEHSNGDWIFYINDRDWVDVRFVPKLIQILTELEKQNVGFVVAGEKWELCPEKDYVVYEKGHDTICEFGLRDQHPTGQIIKRSCWEEVKDRKQYFYDEKYGIYPHGYIEAIIGNHHKGAYVFFDICDKLNYTERLNAISPSGIYRNARGDEYFWPSKRYAVLELLVDNIHLVEDETIWNDIIFGEYRRFFRLATVSFVYASQDEVLKRRYGYSEIKVTDQDVFENGLEFIKKFRGYLEKKNFSWVNEKFLYKLEELETELFQGLIQWLDYRQLSYRIPLKEKYIIFGAGIQGNEALNDYGPDKVLGFCDNSQSKWGKTMGEKRIMSFDEAREKYGDIATFIITPVNTTISVSMARQLCEAGLSYRFWR